MKRGILQVSLIIILLVALTACGAANTGAQPTAEQAQTAQAPAQDAAAGDQAALDQNGRQGGPGNGGRQFTASDLIGEVAGISGNEITVKVMQMPQIGGGRLRDSGDANAQEQTQGQRPQRTAQYTGETKVLKITSEVAIQQTVRDNNGVATQDLKVSDLKAGDIVQVYYSDKTNETISKITVGIGFAGGFGGGGGDFQRGQQGQDQPGQQWQQPSAPDAQQPGTNLQ